MLSICICNRGGDRKLSAVYVPFWIINVLIRYIRLDKPETANKLVGLFRGLWFMGLARLVEVGQRVGQRLQPLF